MPDTPESPASNAPEWTVTSLSGAMKRTLEDAFGHVRVRGEISGYRGPHASGHAYFSLKDETAKIDAVIWRGVFGKLRTKPEEGMEVIATGRITTYPGSSKYQIVIEALEPAGLGALMALLEERRRKLAAEGLFDSARKRALPYLPGVIGVITSPTGAVIRDILHRLSDRFPRRVIVWPVRVQGETSAAEVAAAIRGFNALAPGGPIPRPDVLIVARGGGSLEDLWSFNEEAVVRAAAESTIPLVSAVGHETDWTLIDLAADLRAPTPTGAAEMVVPVRAELAATLDDLSRRRALAMLRFIDRQRTELRAAARALPSGEALVAGPRQRLDLAAGRLPAALMRAARRHEARLAEIGRRLTRVSPQARLAARRARFEGFRERLMPAMARRLAEARRALALAQTGLSRAGAGRARLERERIGVAARRLASIAERLAPAFRALMARKQQALNARAQVLTSLGPEAVLARGYTLVTDEAGRLVPRAADVADGMRLAIRFADGRVEGVAGPGGAPPAARAARPRGPTGGGQGSLF
jgi:exodeoxyribonuclease VII large subunit